MQGAHIEASLENFFFREEASRQGRCRPTAAPQSCGSLNMQALLLPAQCFVKARVAES